MSQQTSTSARAIIHKPPHKPDVESPSVILYGGMPTDPEKDWRADLSASLSDLPIAILDPTCDAWDSTWIEDISFQPFKDQVKWEMDHAGIADVIVFHFGGKTDQPITLLELGLYAHTGKAVVCCQEEFSKKGNVQIVCEKYEIAMCDTVEELKREVGERLVAKLPRK
ncbi:hypothetical protein PtrSN002B_002981 [Pyrenophora tritici-repentis]|nr:Nuc-deoxyri-tr2 domain-containing protein [Pyrenophora tritici-repentis]KAF7571107.1 hypothetical protein PtrM4_111090 [Pyrenophora tritici-repentis]KAG9384162.1 Nuc deoxyri tr2 domain containing protein [Pyrenophora tritici-repentis]KAI0581593.1 Nuc-deoxyri-tr2 domain-containing protein [Pyrenophora tritici-repentis]KAI0623444.1 Nuc-deoxyri-tr2 domain-containing protein [Pyrenophora tritici-repentis]